MLHTLFVIERVAREERLIRVAERSECLGDFDRLGRVFGVVALLNAIPLIHELEIKPDYVSLIAGEKGEAGTGMN
jgi:hypothetical protein